MRVRVKELLNGHNFIRIPVTSRELKLGQIIPLKDLMCDTVEEANEYLGKFVTFEAVDEQTKIKVYIAGAITSIHDYKKIFRAAAEKFNDEIYAVLNPTILPAGLGYEDYMEIDFAMIKRVDEIHFLPNWKKSPGALREHELALELKLPIFYL